MIRSFRGRTPRLSGANFVASSAEVIGDVLLGAEASVWFNATVRGDINWIRIGACSNIQDNAVVHVTAETGPVEIGEFVTVGHSAVVHGCRVGNQVLIGMGAIILDGASIGDECIVGAGALVTQGTCVPPRSLLLGQPARVVRTLGEVEVSRIIGYAENYRRYAAEYLRSE